MSCSRALSVGSASKSFGHTSAEFSNRTKLSSATKARQALNLRLYCFWPGIYNRGAQMSKISTLPGDLQSILHLGRGFARR